MELSDKGLQLILDGEVGGGRKYYDKFLKHPVVPDPEHTSSGVTIGIGWDSGQNTEAALTAEWGPYLDDTMLEQLKKVLGLKGMKAKNALSLVAQVEIGWESALSQFTAFSVPRYWAKTCAAFPGVEASPRSVQEGLLSLVFNRGTDMKGDRRAEMRVIRDLVAERRWAEIPGKVRDMKRLWPDTKGLLVRREAEAAHIESGLEA